MQPYFFPYIGYWQLIHSVDKFVIYDDVNFIKQGWINRNFILANGNKCLVTMHLVGASSFIKINQINIGNNRSKILKTISQSYTKAPYYNNIFPIIQDIFQNDETNLAKFLEYSINRIASFLSLETEIIPSSSLEKDNTLKGQDKILYICAHLNATQYINAPGGRELYNNDDFKEKDISLKFIKTKPIEYTQFKNEFVPWLSIIDVLMFNGKEGTKRLLSEYELL